MQLTNEERMLLALERTARALDPTGELDLGLVEALSNALSAEDLEWAERLAVSLEA